MPNQYTINKNLETFKSLAKKHTEKEIAEILNINQRTVRRYVNQTGIQCIKKIKRKTIEDYEKIFEKEFKNILTCSKMFRKKDGKVYGNVQCKKCGYTWTCQINNKIKNKSICPNCTSGNFGNKYTFDEVNKMINKRYKNHWTLIEYNHYSRKDSIIECNNCKSKFTVKLSEFINKHSQRCAKCERYSTGEYIIANILLFNNIHFIPQYPILINNQKLRVDFFINEQLFLEYNGEQHYIQDDYGFYTKEYLKKINENMSKKKLYAKNIDIPFYEMKYSRNQTKILLTLSKILDKKLKMPTPDFFYENTPNMKKTLEYMKTHSSRQTAKDLKIPTSKIKLYVNLAGYTSIREWQKDNKIK